MRNELAGLNDSPPNPVPAKAWFKRGLHFWVGIKDFKVQLDKLLKDSPPDSECYPGETQVEPRRFPYGHQARNTAHSTGICLSENEAGMTLRG